MLPFFQCYCCNILLWDNIIEHLIKAIKKKILS